MAIIKVVCGIIYKGEQILVCRRNANKHLGGFWEFPGGKVESGEEEKKSLVRELNEELGMKVTIDKHFTTVIHSYGQVTIELSAFFCQFLEASFDLTEHDAYRWVLLEDLFGINFVEADISIVNQLYFKKNEF